MKAHRMETHCLLAQTKLAFATALLVSAVKFLRWSNSPIRWQAPVLLGTTCQVCVTPWGCEAALQMTALEPMLHSHGVAEQTDDFHRGQQGGDPMGGTPRRQGSSPNGLGEGCAQGRGLRASCQGALSPWDWEPID